MAYTVMVNRSRSLYSNGVYSYGLYSYGVYSYGLRCAALRLVHSNGLYSNGPHSYAAAHLAETRDDRAVGHALLAQYRFSLGV